jgi:hypothetical protein
MKNTNAKMTTISATIPEIIAIQFCKVIALEEILK